MRARIAFLISRANKGAWATSAVLVAAAPSASSSLPVPTASKTPMPILPLVEPSRSMELIIALKRSSWARSALSTSQTTLNRLLLRIASSGDSFASMATGRMM